MSSTHTHLPVDHTPVCGVVLVAAGRGERVGGEVPKQFLPLEGIPVFHHALRLFDRQSFVMAIALVLPANGLPADYEPLLAQVKTPLVRVPGGARRQDSVAAGLAALQELAPAVEVALVHDAARPFPPPTAVAELARQAQACGGGLLATPATDTVKRAAGFRVAETFDRTTIWLAQTPQAIRGDLIPRAIAAFRDQSVAVTDEAALLESWGIPVALVDGGPDNFKITHPADLPRAEALLRSRSSV